MASQIDAELRAMIENHPVKTYLISDEVWHRVVQIVQEAMLTGTDVADLLRQIRVVEGEELGSLVLAPAYKQLVREQLQQLLDDAQAMQERRASSQLIKE